MSVIKTNKLTKKFGDLLAVSDVNLDIKPGLITGFLGPNGAGKSTTMNILMGFISATSGESYIFDEKVSVTNIKPRKSLGFLSNNIALDRTLTAGQEIEYFGNLAGGYDAAYVDNLTKKLGLDVSKKIGSLSTGNYQKVGLVIALMHKPKLLVLDEPTNGLDPLVQAEFNKIILELKNQGSTIFISSHILSEVQGLCDEFVFIRRGKIIAQLTKTELVSQSDQTVSVRPSSKDRSKLIKFLRDNNMSFNTDAANLESVFMKYYGGNDAE